MYDFGVNHLEVKAGMKRFVVENWIEKNLWEGMVELIYFTTEMNCCCPGSHGGQTRNS